METSLNIGTAASYSLSKALLIYSGHNQGDQNANLAVTVHDVKVRNGTTTIEAGQPITYAAVESLASALGRNLAPRFLPPNVLSVGFGQVAWFCPADRRRLWFKPDGRFDGRIKDDSETARVMKLNAKVAHHPPLVFVATDHALRVFALVENKRPEAGTKLYVAPYWNLWEGGKLCEGNRKLADMPTPSSIPSYEDGFFNSAFSHTNIKRVCSHPRGHAGLWQHLVQTKKTPDANFWRANLIPTKSTVESVIKSKDAE